MLVRQFDHERLDVYRLSIRFLVWVGELLDGRLQGTRLSAIKHLDEASTSVALNIAEGNGKRSLVDRALDGLDVKPAKDTLVRIVSMLTKLIESLLTRSTSTSTT